jgi:hypothetical protein
VARWVCQRGSRRFVAPAPGTPLASCRPPCTITFATGALEPGFFPTTPPAADVPGGCLAAFVLTGLRTRLPSVSPFTFLAAARDAYLALSEAERGVLAVFLLSLSRTPKLLVP